MAGFFDYTKPGKGVRKDEPEKTGFELYFDILFRRLWKIISLNLIYIIASIPAIIISWFISTYFVTRGAVMAGIDLTEMATALSLLIIFMTVIFLQLCGSGPATAAMSYVLRKYVNDTHSWVWSDFKDNFKSNFKQGIATYFINVGVISVSLFSFLFYTFEMKSSASAVLRFMVALIAIIFAMMQMYTYQLMAGFELKLKHIYKNAFLLTAAKLPWNVLSAAVAVGIVYGVFSITMNIPIVGILAIGLLMFSLVSFTEIFMTNNIVKKYILEPYMKEHPVEEEQFEADFSDLAE